MCVFVKGYAYGRREDGFDIPLCICETRTFSDLEAAGEAGQQTLGMDSLLSASPTPELQAFTTTLSFSNKVLGIERGFSHRAISPA